jgi:hypothetical protein
MTEIGFGESYYPNCMKQLIEESSNNATGADGVKIAVLR